MDKVWHSPVKVWHSHVKVGAKLLSISLRINSPPPLLKMIQVLIKKGWVKNTLLVVVLAD